MSTKHRNRIGYFIGVDFDGTLSTYHKFISPTHTGDPVGPMVDRVKGWLSQGLSVKIFTARVSTEHSPQEIIDAKNTIQAWCVQHIGVELDVVADKSPKMYELWDDKAVGVVLKNCGTPR